MEMRKCLTLAPTLTLTLIFTIPAYTHHSYFPVVIDEVQDWARKFPELLIVESFAFPIFAIGEKQPINTN